MVRTEDLQSMTASMSRDERRYVLPRSYALFAAYYFGLTMEDFMSDMVAFTDANQRSCILLPAGHTKSSSFGRYNIVRHICWNRNVRIQLIMSVFDDAEEYCKSIEDDLTSNERLIEDFGPFYNARDWKSDSFTISGRQHNDPKPTLRVFGAGGKAPNWTLKGQGCDLVVVDDVVTEDTASSPESRKRQLSWFRKAVQRNPRPMWPIDPRYGLVVPRDIEWPADAPYNPKPGSKVPYGQVIVPGTRFDPDDLYKELQDDKTYATMHLDVWAEKNDGVWRSDTTETKPLWPAMWTNEALKAERESDFHMFETRMRNNPMDSSKAVFYRAWLEGGEHEGRYYHGCIDETRSFGELPIDVKTGEKLDLHKVLGFDPASGKATVYATYPTWVLSGIEKGVDLERACRYVIDIYRRQMVGVEDMLDILLDGSDTIPHPGFYGRYKYDVARVEENAFATMFTTHSRFVAAKRRGIHLEPHYTQKNKRDPVSGVKSMEQIVRDGLISIPYRTVSDQELARDFIDQFVYFSFDRNGRRRSHTDYVMAFWFTELAMREHGERGNSVYRHPTSPFTIRNPYYAQTGGSMSARRKDTAKLAGR